MNKNPLFKAPPAFGSRFRNLDAPSLGGLLAPIALLLIISLSLCHAASCTLTWNASSGPDVAGYNLRYGTTSGNPGQPIDVGNTTTRTVSNLNDATTYFFTVTAYNSSRVESQPSNEISYTTPAPTPTLTPTPTPGVIAIGETAVLSTADDGNGNLLVAQQATLPVTSALQSMSFYVTNASGQTAAWQCMMRAVQEEGLARK